MSGGRFRTLFSRLMLAQSVILVFASMALPVIVTGARFRAACPAYAELWSPRLIQAATQAAGETPRDASEGFVIDRRTDLPADIRWMTRNLSPYGYGAGCAQSFLDHDVPLIDMRLALEPGIFRVWFQLASPNASPPTWLGVRLPPVWFQPTSALTLYVLLPMLALTVLVTWLFARWVTRPLEELGRRIDRDANAMAHGMPAPGHAPLPMATSEVRAIERHYRELIDRLQLIERERGLMLAGVSHDLRSPLSRIRLAAEVLPLRSDPKADLAIITRNVDQADRLVGSFLDFVRVGRLNLDETVDVLAVTRTVTAKFSLPPAMLELRQIVAGSQARDEPACLLKQANTLLLDRLLFNLVDNALKHGQPPVVVRLTHGNEVIEIDVCDAGPGFPSATPGELMAAFARGDASRGSTGSGLGLAIVQQITARLGGTLAFRQDSSGNHVLVDLPTDVAIRQGQASTTKP